MAITLGAHALPDGLVWQDETEWTPVRQSVQHTLSGALVLEEAQLQAGRPITLIGGRQGGTSWAWMARADLLALQSDLESPGATLTLTLHDARAFTVTGRHDSRGPVDAYPLPVVGERGPANPDTTHRYVIDAIRLMAIQ